MPASIDLTDQQLLHGSEMVDKMSTVWCQISIFIQLSVHPRCLHRFKVEFAVTVTFVAPSWWWCLNSSTSDTRSGLWLPKFVMVGYDLCSRLRAGLNEPSKNQNSNLIGRNVFSLFFGQSGSNFDYDFLEFWKHFLCLQHRSSQRIGLLVWKELEWESIRFCSALCTLLSFTNSKRFVNMCEVRLIGNVG